MGSKWSSSRSWRRCWPPRPRRRLWVPPHPPPAVLRPQPLHPRPPALSPPPPPPQPPPRRCHRRFPVSTQGSSGPAVVGSWWWGCCYGELLRQKTWDPAGSCFILRSSMSLNCSISYRRTLHANLFSFFHYLKELLQESGARSACNPPSLGLCVFFFCCDHIISKLFRIPLLFTVDNSVLEAFPRKS